MTRYKFDNVTVNHLCREIQTKLPNAVDLSQPQPKITMMLQREREMRIGISYKEVLRQSNKAIFLAIPSTDEFDEAKLNDYMALLLWIGFVQLCCLFCSYLSTKNNLVCSSISKESKAGYYQVVEYTGRCTDADTSCGIITSNYMHATIPSCTTLPCQCMCKSTVAMHLFCLLNIKAAMFYNLLLQHAFNYLIEIQQVTEQEKDNVCYQEYVSINKADHCNDDQIQSSRTAEKNFTVTKLDSSVGSLIQTSYGQCFCYYSEQCYFEICTTHYTIKMLILKGDAYFLNRYGIQSMSCKTAMIIIQFRNLPVCISLCHVTLTNSASKASKFFVRLENSHQAQATVLPYVNYVPNVYMFTCNSKPNASDVYMLYLLESLLHKCLYSVHNQVTSLARCAHTHPILKVLLCCNLRSNSVVKFYINACRALQLNSTLLFPETNQLLNCLLIVHHTWYDNMLVDAAQQCTTATIVNRDFHAEPVTNEVCQEKQVVMYESMCGMSVAYYTIKLVQGKNIVAIQEGRNHYILLGNFFHAALLCDCCHIDIPDLSTMHMTLTSRQYQACQNDFSETFVDEMPLFLGHLLLEKMLKVTNQSHDDRILPSESATILLQTLTSPMLPTIKTDCLSSSNLTVACISQNFGCFSRQLHLAYMSFIDCYMKFKYNVFCLTKSGIWFMLNVTSSIDLQLRHVLVILSSYQGADGNPIQCMDQYTDGLIVITEQGHKRNATLLQMSGYKIPVIQLKISIMRQLLVRYEVPKAKPSVKFLKITLKCCFCLYLLNTSDCYSDTLTESSSHSVPKLVRTKLTTMLHYVKYVQVLLGQHNIGELNSLPTWAHSLTIQLNSALVFQHKGCGIDISVQTCVTAHLALVKTHPCYGGNKKTADVVECLVTHDICLTVWLNGTFFYSQSLATINWKYLSYILYSNSLPSVVKQFTPVCLNRVTNDDESVVNEYDQASVYEVYYITSKCSTAVEGNLLAVTASEQSRYHVKSSALYQVPIVLLRITTLIKSFFVGVFTTSSMLVCSEKYIYQDKVLVSLHVIVLMLRFIEIIFENTDHGYADNTVVYEPCSYPNKVTVTENDTSGSTHPLVTLPKSKLNSSYMCIMQYFHCCDSTSIDQILTLQSKSHSQTWQYRALTVNFHLWYWDYFHMFLHHIASLERLTATVSVNNLLHKETVELLFDKLISSSKNCPVSRFMWFKLINTLSTTAENTLSCENKYRINSIGAFNNFFLMDVPNPRWCSGKTALLLLLLLGYYPYVMKTMPNAHNLFNAFCQQLAVVIPWAIAFIQTVTNPQRIHKPHKMILLPLQHLKPHGVVLTPEIAADVTVVDRNSLAVKTHPTTDDELHHQITIASTNAFLQEQFVKSTISSSKCLLMSCEFGAVKHFILSHILASHIKLMISTLYHKTLVPFFEHMYSKNGTLSADVLMALVITILRFNISPVCLEAITTKQLYVNLKYPNSLVFDSTVINRMMCEAWFVEFSKACINSHRVYNLKLSTYSAMKPSMLITLAQFLSQVISATSQQARRNPFQEFRLFVYCLFIGEITFTNTARNFMVSSPMTQHNTLTKFSSLLDHEQSILLDAKPCSNAAFYKIIVALAYHEFVKKRVQDIYQKTSKQFSCMLSVSFPKYVEHLVVELISDLLIFRKTHMLPVMTDSHSVSENKMLMYLSSLYSCTKSSGNISKTLSEYTIAAQLLTHQMTTINCIKWTSIPSTPVMDMVLQEGLLDLDRSITVLVHGRGKRVSHHLNVILVGKYVIIGTYQYSQFVNMKLLVDKWSLISHNRVCGGPLLNVVQQLLWCFTTLLSDKFMGNTICQIADKNVISAMLPLKHKYTIPPHSIDSSEYHLNSNPEHFVCTTIPLQLSGYLVSSNVNFPMVVAMNMIISSGVSFHAFSCIDSDLYSSNHMSSDGLAVTNISHHKRLRGKPQWSTEIEVSITMVFKLQSHDDTSDFSVIFSSKYRKFMAGNNTCIMTQHFALTIFKHDPFDKQQMSCGIYSHTSYKRIHITLEFNLILHNRKLHPVILSTHSFYNLVTVLLVLCSLAVRRSKSNLNDPLNRILLKLK